MLCFLVLIAITGLTIASPPLGFVTQFGPLDIVNGASTLKSSCPISGPTSCHNSSAVPDLCCFEAPGGLLLQTQFWDTKPSTGPTDSWTIHGLWPDNCDTTFEENCDPSRAYTNIASLLSQNGADDILDFMQTHWVDINGHNERFWEHEWSTHGTCMSTLEPQCLPSGSDTGSEAVAFFQTVVRLFKSLPTYDWLASQGITPSTTKTFTLATLLSALEAASGGFKPALDCSGKTLNQISWYFNLRGSIIDGTFVPIDAPKRGSCPSSGIKYPPKNGSPSPTTTSHPPKPTSGDLPEQATIQALPVRSNSPLGGLLSAGTWSTQTLAKITLSGDTSSFTMTSSRGSCGIIDGALICGSDVTPASFSAVFSAGHLLLASDGTTAWTSDGTPKGSKVYTVHTGSSRAQDYSLSIVGL